MFKVGDSVKVKRLGGLDNGVIVGFYEHDIELFDLKGKKTGEAATKGDAKVQLSNMKEGSHVAIAQSQLIKV